MLGHRYCPRWWAGLVDGTYNNILQQIFGRKQISQATLVVEFLPESHRYELGETLTTLIFAQRAMSVTAYARVNVTSDLEGRCVTNYKARLTIRATN
ncbi:unnamed protein product [Hapterophycus canaliculatus]